MIGASRCRKARSCAPLAKVKIGAGQNAGKPPLSNPTALFDTRRHRLPVSVE
jgi:hypothetical protein